MKRIVFNAPDEMADAVQEQAKKRRAPTSAIIREALEEYFEKRGVTFDVRVEWGKPTEPDEPLGQAVEVAAT